MSEYNQEKLTQDVLKAFANRQVPRVERVQAFVMAHHPGAHVPQAAHDGKQDEQRIQRGFPVHGRQE